MNNKAFRNLFCNQQKSFHTSPIRTIEAVNHYSNSTIALTKNFTSSRNFFLVNATVEFEEWLKASIIRVGRFRRGVKTLLCNYRINYQKLCYLMRQITKDLNSAILSRSVNAWIIV